MAIDVHGLNFLAFAKANKVSFATVLTLGRQAVQVGEPDLRRFLESFGRKDLRTQALLSEIGGPYCENLLKLAFGANTVDSIDASDYEGATIVHDMNAPLAWDKQYSLVIDFGCLEHIFNVPVALDNIAAGCSVGGHILHVLPGNNLCGHGFYQFSPELFFGLYAENRGFRGTQVFVAELGDTSKWYEVTSPQKISARVNITTSDEMYVLVFTQKTASTLSSLAAAPQQFDYVVAWGKKELNKSQQVRSRSRDVLVRTVKKHAWAYHYLNRLRRRIALHKTRLRRALGVVEQNVAELILPRW